MNELLDHIVAITGGCGDIGRAAAARFVDEGARVHLLDLVPKTVGDALADELDPAGKVEYAMCDTTSRPRVEAVLTHIVKRHGRLDAVVVNAGVVNNQGFLDITIDDWERTLAVNLTGAFHTAQVAARIMASQAPDPDDVRGKILFTGSWVQDMPWPGGSAYIVSKAGLKALARNMAQELADQRILVNVIAPGIVMAGLSRQEYERDPAFGDRAAAAIPLGAFGTPEQVADAMAFMISRRANYMTGSVVLIDGGASLVKRT